MSNYMPCGKDEVWHFKDPEKTAKILCDKLHYAAWFGFAEVDIEVPKNLNKQFEEMCPLFHNKDIHQEMVSEEMLEYLKNTGRTRTKNQKKLVGAMSAPLLKWYIQEGLIITKCYRTINYKPQKIFQWFVEEVTTARRAGDVDKEKAIFAEVFKLLGNSAYGKLIEAVERHTNTA